VIVRSKSKLSIFQKRLKAFSCLLRPSSFVLLFYVLFVVGKLSVVNYNPTAFIFIGRFFIERDPSSPISRFVLGTMGLPSSEFGYDGQIYYYMALDPLSAWRNLDTNGRYARILFSLAVKVFSLGNPFLIPAVMIAVNIVSIVVGTELVSKMLCRRGKNRWFSLVYGLYIGHLFVVARDCIESFSYMFVLLGIYVIEDKQRLLPSASLFSLALFAKETAILFVGGYLLDLILRRSLSFKNKLLFFVISVVPYALYQFYLYALFGFIPILTVGNPLTSKLIPYSGVFASSRSLPELLNIAFMIFLPSIVGLLYFGKDLLHRIHTGLAFGLFFNILFMMFLPTPSYWSIQDYSRISIGLATAFLVYSIHSQDQHILKYSLTLILPMTTYFTYG